MTMRPLPLLLSGYGLSLTAALALAAVAGGLVAPILTFWLGGAVATLALGAVPRFRRSAADPERADDDPAEYAAALARWERDRAAERFADDDRSAAV